MSAILWPDDDIGRGYSALACAIVKQASEDYKEAMICLIEADTRAVRRHAVDGKREVEDFFLGEWFAALSTLDPDAIMEALERRVAEEEERRQMNLLRLTLRRYRGEE